MRWRGYLNGFIRCHGPGSEKKSTGLGLALVREIAHLHGGDAALTNRPGGWRPAECWVPIGS